MNESFIMKRQQSNISLLLFKQIMRNPIGLDVKKKLIRSMHLKEKTFAGHGSRQEAEKNSND